MKPECLYFLRTSLCGRCEAKKCVSGFAADNYPHGFRKPDGEVWPSYGVDTSRARPSPAPILHLRSSHLHCSKLPGFVCHAARVENNQCPCILI